MTLLKTARASIRLFFPIILMVCSGSLFAQNIINGTVTDTLNNPIPYASVYLSKTTTGVSTDSRGFYSLKITQDGVYEMIASCVGFKTTSQLVKAEGGTQSINFQLKVNAILIDAVTVKADDKNRYRDYNEFKKLFLGESGNSQSCRIANLNDLCLHRDPQTKIIKGFSTKPLVIENRSLGYKIIYDLTEFNYDPATGILKFTGNHYFKPLEGSFRSKKKWETYRLNAYYGSRMHLLRSVFQDSVAKESFKLFENNTDPSTKEVAAIKPIEAKKFKIPGGKSSMGLFYGKTIWVDYTENHPEIFPGGLLGFRPEERKSSILFNDTLLVFRNGYFINPYAVTWNGSLADERIADMLPYDYDPKERIVEVSETNERILAIDKYLESQQKSNCTDQVFVHTDRNLYRPGDTLFFQAYVRNRLTGVFETKSASLYALLFNDKKEKVDSARFKVEGSTASGWMSIPSSAKTGRYHFVAFTSTMQNFDPSDAFQFDMYVDSKEYTPENIAVSFDKEQYQSGDDFEATVRVTNPKRKPISKRKIKYYIDVDRYTIFSGTARTDEDGLCKVKCNLPDTIVEQPKLHIIAKQNTSNTFIEKDFSLPFKDRYLDLRFLPEGGTLVAGLEQRIGFNATNRRGETVRIEGLLRDKDGKIIDTVRSGEYGPGMFVCKPKAGMYVELVDSIYETRTWPLSDIIQSGISLSMKQVDKRSFSVEVQSDQYRGEPVVITGTMNLNKVFSQELKLDKKQRIIVETDNLPSGVVQVTLFDKSLKPIAERLLYVNADQHLKFNIKVDKDVIDAGQETELAISVSDGSGNPVDGIFSLAVADSLTGHKAELFTPGIEYAMNYNPYLLGNLPPKALLQGLENISAEQRDLLLMVYGWKRYKWDLEKQKGNENNLINYDVLNMKILYALKSRREDRRLDLVSLEGPSTMHFRTNKNGEVSLPLDSLPKVTRSVIMMPDVKNKMRVEGAMLSVPFNQQFFKSNKLFIPSLSIPTYKFDVRSYSNKPFTSLSDTTLEIPEIVVIGRKKEDVEYVDSYAELYKYANIKSVSGQQLWSAFSFEDALRRASLSPMLGPTSIFGKYSGALYVLDGQPLYRDGYKLVSRLTPEELTSITVLKGKEGFAMYGEAANFGVIFVNTWARVDDSKLFKLRNEWKLQNSNDHMLLPIEIYRPTIEYYNPTKAEVNANSKLQSSPTIYWKSEVYFNGKEPVKIKFTNLSHIKRDGVVVVSVNGVSSSNLTGSSSASYIVTKVD